jgi:WD40 repeat protein
MLCCLLGRSVVWHVKQWAFWQWLPCIGTYILTYIFSWHYFLTSHDFFGITHQIWDSRAARRLHQLNGHIEAVQSCAFVPQSHLYVVCCYLLCLDLTPICSHRFLTCGNDSAVRIWDADSGVAHTAGTYISATTTFNTVVALPSTDTTPSPQQT